MITERMSHTDSKKCLVVHSLPFIYAHFDTSHTKRCLKCHNAKKMLLICKNISHVEAHKVVFVKKL